MNRRPRIGITTACGVYDSGSLQGKPRQWVSTAYAEAIASAGGVPVLLPVIRDPLQRGAVIRRLVDDLDGLVITGGSGVLTTGLVDHDDTSTQQDDGTGPLTFRTECDEEFLSECIRGQRPVLGVCFGMQLINAHFGGAITTDWHAWQRHAGDEVTVAHTASRGGAEVGCKSHTVQVVPGSHLHGIVGYRDVLAVNSMHVQGIARHHVPQGLVVAATAPDGCVEALETTEQPPLLVGIQWHPEQLESVPEQRAIWEDLVQRAGEKRRHRWQSSAHNDMMPLALLGSAMRTAAVVVVAFVILRACQRGGEAVRPRGRGTEGGLRLASRPYPGGRRVGR